MSRSPPRSRRLYEKNKTYKQPSIPATMDQYQSRDGDLLLGDSTDLPLLAMPLMPRLIIEEMVLESSVGSPVGEPVAAPSHGMPDLSREDPFDVHQDASESGPLRELLEYVGAPESARLLSRSPEYWLHHMGWDRTMSAALQLQHDAGLILSNLQVLGQFVTSLNRMSSEVMPVAFMNKPFPTEAVQFVAPSHRVRRVAHYMAAKGLWRPPCTQGIPGPLLSSSCVHDHDVCGLLSRPSEVEKTETWCSVFPSGEGQGCVTLCFMYITCHPTRLVVKKRLI